MRVRTKILLKISSKGSPEPLIEYPRNGITAAEKASRPIGLNGGGKVREGWDLGLKE
jgi:hypothetical protein